MDSRERKTGFGGWWARYRGAVAWLALLLVAVVGFAKIQGLHIGPVQIDGTVEQVQAERAARSDSVTGVITLLCRTNNEQDATLAKLVAVSLGGGSFGEDIDPGILTDFDIAVLSSIAKVQAATKDEHLQRVFRRQLKELRDPLTCHQLVKRFEEGKPIPPPVAP